MEEIRQAIHAYILDKFLPGEDPADLTDQTPLITGGILDSIRTLKLVVFLEDRRVLYNAMDLEVVSQVDRSIYEIRDQCTKTLQSLSAKVFAVAPIRAIREAGRRFHDDQQEEFRFFDGRRNHHEGSPGFFTALGALRASIGQQVALLAAYYDIDVEGDLAAVLPKPDTPS